MKKTLKILSWICAAVLIFGTVSVGMTAYAVSDDVIGDYDFDITNVYKDIDWNNVTAYKSETHVHTVRSDADTEVDDMIHKYYELGFDAMALTDHGTVNYGWDHDQGRDVIFDYQYFVHGAVDNLKEDDYKNIITGQRSRSINSGKGMMEIPLGNEMNGMSTIKCHVNGYYADAMHGEMALTADWPENAVKQNYNKGGFSHINHVGEWSGGNDEREVYSKSWLEDFAEIFETYCPNKGGRNAADQGTRGVIGMELVNTADSRTWNDRRWVYDEILKILAPKGINVFGFCEDDAHEYSDCDRNAQYFLINNDKSTVITSALFDASNNESGKTSDYKNQDSDPIDKVQNYYRNAMFYGEFYASSKNSKNSYELGNGFVANGAYPSISNISVDNAKDQISVTFKDATKVRLVADGNIIDTVKTSAGINTAVFDLNKYEHSINSYVRIYLTGAGGITYLQPFVVTKTESRNPTVQFVSPDVDEEGNPMSLTSDIEVVVKDSHGSVVDLSLAYTNNYYKLPAGTYTYTASRRGYQPKTEEFTVTDAEYNAGEQKKIPVVLEENDNVTYAYFYAPETIYLSPSDNKTFDLYFDRENAVNGALHNSPQKTGNVYFYREGAKNIEITYNTVEGEVLIDSLAMGSTTAAETCVSTSITSGVLAKAISNDGYVLIKWTAKYKLNGIDYETYTYSYVYKTPTGSSVSLGAGAYAKTKKWVMFGGWAHDTMYVAASIYAFGINELEHNNTPDVDYAGYKFAPYSGYEFDDYSTSLSITGSGYIYQSKDSDGGSVKLELKNNDIGNIYADRSRVNNWSQIPNLRIGFDFNDVDEATGENGDSGSYGVARLLFDTSLTAARDATYHPEDVLFNLSFTASKSNYTRITDYNLTDDTNLTETDSASDCLETYGSQRFYMSDNSVSSKTLVAPLPSATIDEVIVPVSAYVKGTKESRRDEICLEMDLCVVNVDKSGLRTELNNTIKEMFQHDWFRSDEEFENYQDTIQRAAKVLGNPTSTADEIETAKTNLMEVYDNFELKTGVYTVKHYWQHNGQTGLIINDGTKTFGYGDDISANAMDITGYTYANRFECYAKTGVDSEMTLIKSGTADFDTAFAEKDTYEWIFYYNPDEFNVTYTSSGANPISSYDSKAYFGQPYTVAAEIPQKTGYTFGGWYLDNAMKNYSAGSTIRWDSASDGEFTAEWVANSYDITYDVNGGNKFTVPEDYQKASYGDTYKIVPEVPTKTGYKFAGWKLNDNQIYTSGGNVYWDIAADSTFVAQWTIAIFDVDFDLGAADAVLKNGNTDLASDYKIQVLYGEPYGTLPSAVRNGYTSEWYSDPNFANASKVQATTDVSIESNHTLFAKWTATDYNISYELDGGSVGGNNPTSYTVETSDITLINPVKTGYRFVGWTGSNGATPSTSVTIPTGTTGDKSYVANWDLSGYNISYYLDGGTNNVNNPSSYKVTESVTIYAPTKAGYEFRGWTGSNGTTPQKTVTIPAGSTDEKAYTANWDLITYTIDYDYDGADPVASNPTSYSFETATFTLGNPEKAGYTFNGWICTIDGTKYNALSGKNVTIENGEVTGNLSFKADWAENGANIITYENIDGASVEGTNPTSYKFGDTFTLINPKKDGYTFEGWTKTVGSTTSAATMTATVLGDEGVDITFTATWSIDTYTIEYNLDNGTVSGTNPATYNAESEKITLIQPTKTGYTFEGWTGTGLTEATANVEIPTGSTGNRSYTATWKLESYTIRYNLYGGTAGGSNPDKYNVESAVITLINPVKAGYSFEGWTGSNGTTPSTSVTIATGSTGNKTYDANWSLTTYTITYVLNGGKVDGTNPNPTGYSYDSSDILLVNPTKTGYTFNGWEYDGTVYAKATIPKGSTGDRIYTAIFEKTEYTITYAGIDGATVAANPATYSVDSSAITLSNPSKTGYTFEGWVGSGLSSASMEVTIPTGSTGNKSYTATWTPLSYSITYNGLEGATIKEGKTNPNGYTIETNTFTLNPPVKSGAEFAGWTSDNGSSAEMTVTIPKGSTGNKTYTAQWNYNDYIINYDLAGGTETTNPASYRVSSEDINLNAPVRAGYTFTGWTGTGLDGITLNVKIPTGSTGNRNYKANWQAINYNITYILNGGQVATNANPRTYTVESQTIELVNPVKTGSVFQGWTGTELSEPTMTVIIPKGSTSNRTYTATWVENSYTITYTNIDGATFAGENRTTYNEATNDFTLNNPSKRGYIFNGWSGTKISGSGISDSVTIPKGSSGNRSYKANWTLEEYTITYDFDGGTEGISNPRSYTVKDTPFTLYAPVKTGFEFAGWESDYSADIEKSVTIDPSVTNDDLNFKATWTSGSYVITLDTKEGTLPAGQDSEITYTYDSADITIQNPTRDGFTFAGWTGTGLTSATKSLVIPQHSTGNRSYVANWTSSDKNIITYNLNGGKVDGTNPETYETDSGMITLIKPTKDGYKFNGWTVDNDEAKEFVSLTSGGRTAAIDTSKGGSVILSATWAPVEYRITYNLNGGDESTNPVKYTIETAAFTLNNPVRPGYTFAGWTGTDIDPTAPNSRVTILEKMGNRTYTAVWTEEEYPITYNYNGGSTSEPNPTSYSIASASFTLNNPVKAGYTFTGWTGTGITGAAKNVTITTGSTGARTYTANFSSDTYTITYLGVEDASGYPTEYTVDSADISIENPTKFGYEFLGWKHDGSLDPEKDLVIKHGSTGSKTLTAQWGEAAYQISYNLDGGQIDGTNPETYSIESADIKLINPTRAGYIFLGWTGTGITGSSKNVTIVKGSSGDRSYTATWETAPFTISYTGVPDGAVAALNLPTGYTAAEAVTIPNAEKTGYNFSGWTGTGLMEATKDLVLPQGTTGNKNFKATWSIIDYELTINYEDGEPTATVPDTFNVDSPEIVLSAPRRTGYTFTGWTGTGLTALTLEVKIPTGSINNRTYTANWTVRTGTKHKIYFRGYQDVPLYVDVKKDSSGAVIEHRDYVEVEIGQPVTDEFYTHPETIDTTAGYKLTGWNIDVNKPEYMNLDDDIVVYAKWDVDPIEYTVQVNGSEAYTEIHTQFEKVTVTTAYENENGDLFSHWVANEVDENGNIISGQEITSYYRNHSFYISSNVVLIAVYGETSPVRATTRISTIEEYDPNYDWFTPNSERSVATELTLAQHGIIFTSNASVGSSEGSFLLGKTGVYNGVAKTKNLTGTWALSIPNPYMLRANGDTVYIRSYVIVIDEDGAKTTKYSAIRTYLNNQDKTDG